MSACVLTAPEVAALLRISISTVYALARSGRLPRAYVGRSVRFPAAAIRAIVDRAEIVTPEPHGSAPPGRTRRPGRQWSSVPNWDAAMQGRRERRRRREERARIQAHGPVAVR